jgi:16S rRNA (adenine1518-N6/adenine1519-N6)-dimethyltransferase
MTTYAAPRRRFSQNFLVDRHYLGRIVEAIGPAPSQTIVEIGPGRGALTRLLLERIPHLTAVEIDRDLAHALEQEFPRDRLTIITADALKVDLGAVAAPGQQMRIVGNLPYHISTPLLFHFARFVGSISDMHFLLQQEVVDRMAAAPGTPDYGRLSVTLQSLFDVQKLFSVPAGAFHPAPTVTSAIVRLSPLRERAPGIADRATFEAVVAAGFSQRRKTLRNALRAVADEAVLHSVGIDAGVRAETLPVQAFCVIANAVAARRDLTSAGTQALFEPGHRNQQDELTHHEDDQ